MKWMTKKTLLIVFLSLVALYGLSKMYFGLNGSFSVNGITSDFSFRDEFQLPPPSPKQLAQVKQILDQKFTYLNKGAQAYAFLSEDGLYVLKIVRQKHYKFSTLEDWALQLPFFEDVRKKKMLKRKRKKMNFIASCMLCYEEMREETALHYVHMSKTNDLQATIRLNDKLGISHDVDPNQIEFVIQSKADPLTSRIHELMSNNDVLGAQKALHRVLDLFFKCWQKGIADRDINFVNNIGFVGDQAIFIDIGEFYKGGFVGDKAIYVDIGEFYKEGKTKMPDVYKRSISNYFIPLTEWLQEHYPQLQMTFE